MSSHFSFQQEPCLDFLQSDTPQSNSLLANIMVKQQGGEQNHFGYHFIQSEHFQSQVQASNMQQFKQRSSRPKTKQKKKVFYRDKMAELMHEQNYVKQQYNYVDFAQFEKGKSPISREEQLKRNRESAKQSRQRKKEYVETLEDKNKANHKQISQLTQRLRQTQLQRDRLKESNNAHIQSFNTLKSEVYEKLSILLDQSSTKPKQVKSTQIDACITDLREKFGSAGKQRVNLVNYYMCEIIQNLITDFQKYLINCAISGTGIFIDSGEMRNSAVGMNKIDAEIGHILGLNELKKNCLVSKFQERFKKQAMLFNTICQQLYQSFSLLINQSSILENIFNDMRRQFEPQQVARLILYFEENKFRKDLRKMRNEWYENFRRNEDQVVDSIRKITKKYEY